MSGLSDLTSVSRDDFEAGLRSLKTATLATGDLIEQARLISTSSLEKREIDLRINQLFIGRDLSSDDIAVIVKTAQGHGTLLRQALQNILPPEHRRALYRKNAVVREDIVTPSAVVEPQVNPPAQSNAQLKAEGRSVILLGAARHDANSSLLQSHDYTPINILTLSDIENCLSRDEAICGIVIDGSWWTVIPKEKHTSFLERILKYSSFYFIKIDESFLDSEVSKQLHTLCRKCRFRAAEASEIALGRSSHLVGSDIEALNVAAKSLAAYAEIRIYPADISDREGLVILAALQKRHLGKLPFQPIQIERVGASLIRGGKSDAKVILLRNDANGAPLIAKVSSPTDLQQEMMRFKMFIEPWDNRVAPELHVQSSTGAILFALVDGQGDASEPAPTLADRIYELDGTERGASSTNTTLFQDLKDVISRTASRLTALNKRPIGQTEIPNLCWLTASPLKVLEANEVRYNIVDGGVQLDLASHLDQAIQKVASLNGKAIVHGDIHLANVLVRNDREPAFVDFAYSGPGHPCFDLARLEAAILYPMFRQVDTEDNMTDLFERVFCQNASLDDLGVGHSDFCASKVARLALHTSIEVRTRAKEVLSVYQGDMVDLFAVKLIIAAQALALSTQNQSAVVRASIRAIVRCINNATARR